ncbi:MAG: helix-turn-helix domain-containing protein, partial [Syntrophales bacterium]
ILPYHLPSLKGEGLHRPHRWQESDPNRMRKEELIRILQDTGGNRQKAACLLGISRVTLWKLLKRHDIRIEPRIRSDAGDTKDE